MYVAGDDPAARDVAASVLRELGWTDIVAFDSLAAARGMEWMLPMWLNLMRHLQTPVFNLKLIRAAH